MNKDELAGMLAANADEPYAEEIAKAIMNARKRRRELATTMQLKAVIEEALSPVTEGMSPAEKKDVVKKSCQRTFQALRIDVNNEYEALEKFMEKLPDALTPGGRAAILTFHSGEDRIVKQAFRQFKRDGIYSDVAADVIRPTAEECVRNSRAHSTKMRWAIRA